MLLQNKNAVIYGAGGSLGGAVAKALADAGARLFLTGRHLGSVEKVAAAIRSEGGQAESAGGQAGATRRQVEAAEVDATDEEAVRAHLESVVRAAGSVDISFNAVGQDLVQNIPLTEISVEDFVSPIELTMRTRFITAKAAALVMMRQRSGVILSLTATPGGIGYPYTGGFAPACAAVEKLAGNLGAELGIYGIRVVNIRSAGSPDSRVFLEAVEKYPEAMAAVFPKMLADTMLKKLPVMADIANVAVFLCSDQAALITGVTVDVTAGTTTGLNYRVSLESRTAREV